MPALPRMLFLIKSLLFMGPSLSADFDGAVFVDGDRITCLDGLEELVTEQVDGDGPPLIPDVVDNQPAG